MSGKASEIAEDDVERFQQLIADKGYARVVDIARSCRIIQASVTRMEVIEHPLSQATALPEELLVHLLRNNPGLLDKIQSNGHGAKA